MARCFVPTACCVSLLFVVFGVVQVRLHHHNSSVQLLHVDEASVLLQELDVTADEEVLRRVYLTAVASQAAFRRNVYRRQQLSDTPSSTATVRACET